MEAEHLVRSRKNTEEKVPTTQEPPRSATPLPHRDSSSKINYNDNQSNIQPLTQDLENPVDFLMDALSLYEITDAKLKDKTFYKIFNGILETAKAGKSSSLYLLSWMLINEIKSTDDASKPIIKELKKIANEQLIFNLRATLQSIIRNEKANKNNLKESTNEKEIEIEPLKDENSTTQEDKRSVQLKRINELQSETFESSTDLSDTLTIVEGLEDIKDALTSAQTQTIEEHSQTFPKSEIKVNDKSSLQMRAELSTELLHKVLWELDPLSTLLVIKHIKEPLRIILDIVSQFYLVKKHIKPITKESKEEEGTEEKNIINSYLEALVDVAKKYIVGAAEESHPANMKSIPEGVRQTIVAIATGAILEYYSEPHEKGRVIMHTLVSQEGVEYPLEIPIEIIIKIFKTITALQLDHGITEDAENFEKETKKLFKGKKITDHFFNNDQLIQDLSNLVYSLKFLLYFKASLDKEHRSFIDKNLPTIVNELIIQIKNKFSDIMAQATKRQTNLSKHFLTIENFIISLKDDKKITDEMVQKLQIAVESLPADDSNKKEIKFRNELKKLKSAKDLLDGQKKFVAKLKRILASKNLSKHEEDLRTNIENLLKQSESTDFKDAVNQNPEQSLESFIQSFFNCIASYKIRRLAPERKEQLGNTAFQELIGALANISLKKDLSQADIDTITKTLAIKLEDIKNGFSNPALGKALYDAFVESIPLSDKDIELIENSLTDKAYSKLKNISNKKLGSMLFNIFSDAQPVDSDVKQILKCLRKDRQKQTKLLQELNKLKSKNLGAALYPRLLNAITTVDNSLNESDVNLIVESLEPKNYDALLRQFSCKSLSTVFHILFNKNPLSETDAKKIITCLKKENLTELATIEEENLNKILPTFFEIIFKKKNAAILNEDVDVIAKYFRFKDYAFLKNLSNKELGDQLYTRINQTPPNQKDADKIVKALQSNNLTELQKIKYKNLGPDLYNLLKGKQLTPNDLTLIAKIAEPITIVPFLQIATKNINRKFYDLVCSEKISENDAKKIFRALDKNEPKELVNLQNQTLGENLQNLLTSFSPEEIKKLAEILKFNKKFYEIINAASGQDIKKIIAALEKNNLGELTDLEDQNLSENLHSLFIKLSKNEIVNIAETFKKENIAELFKSETSDKSKGHVSQIKFSEIHAGLRTIINTFGITKSDAKIIAESLQKNKLNQLLKLKNKTLGTVLRAFFILVSAKENISYTEEDISIVEESLKPKNYNVLRNLSNATLGAELCEIFNDNPPREEDIQKIVKCLRQDALWQKKELNGLLKLKDKTMGARLYQALFASIPFTKEDAEKFCSCLKDNQVEEIGKISNKQLSGMLRQAFINNSLPPVKISLSICDSLKNRNIENLKRCGYPELGEALYKALYETVAPSENDKRILLGILDEIEAIRDENINDEEKKRVLEKLRKYSNPAFATHLAKTFFKMQFSRISFREAIANLLRSNKLEDLTGRGSPGNEIYYALIQSIPLSAEDIQTINRCLKTKNLEGISNIDNVELGQKLFNVFKNSTSYSPQDIDLSEQIFLDPYKKFKQLFSFPELGEVLYSIFQNAKKNGNPPIITDDDIKIIIEGLTANPQEIEKISDKEFGKRLCETIRNTLVTNDDKFKIVKAILDSKPEDLLKISNQEFGSRLYNALKNLRLKNSFEFTPLQRFLIAAIVATPNSLIGLLERLSKKKKEEKPLVRVEQLPEMLFEGIVKQPDKNFMDTIRQLSELPLPPLFKNILDQLKYYFTDTDNEFCHELEKVLHSTMFLPSSFEILQKLLDQEEFKKRIGMAKQIVINYNTNAKSPSKKLNALTESQDFLADYDKLPQKKKNELLKIDEFKKVLTEILNNPLLEFRKKLIIHTNEIKVLAEGLENLFINKDFLKAYEKLPDNVRTELRKRIETNPFYNNYSSFILLVLFMSHPLDSEDYQQIVQQYIKSGQMTLEAFTYEALKILGMPESEWPDFMKTPSDSTMKELLERIAKLGSTIVTAYNDDKKCSEEEKIYPEVLVSIGMRMLGLYGDKTKFSPENPFHKLLIKSCCVDSLGSLEKPKSQEFFEQFSPENRAPTTADGVALVTRIIDITISSIPTLIHTNPKLLIKRLSFAIKMAYENNMDTSQLFFYCIANQLTDAIEEAFRDEKASIDVIALKAAIRGRHVETVKTILDQASKYDITILVTQNDKENLLGLACEAEKDSSNYPIFKMIVNHLSKATMQPYPLILAHLNDEALSQSLQKTVKEMGLSATHYMKNKHFPSPKTTTSSNSGNSSSEDPESHSSTERSVEKAKNSGEKQEATEPYNILKEYIDQNKIDEDNLKALLKDDPEAGFLATYLKSLIESYKKSQVTNENINKFNTAVAIVLELIDRQNKKLAILNLSSQLKGQEKLLKSIPLMEELFSLLQNESNYENFYMLLSNNESAKPEKLQELYKVDPNLLYLSKYIVKLAPSYSDKDPVNAERIAKKFAAAAKITIKFLPLTAINSVLENFLSSLMKSRSSFYDREIETLIEFSKEHCLKILSAMLDEENTKEIKGIKPEEKEKNICLLFKNNNQGATEYLLKYIRAAKVETSQFSEILELIIKNELIYFDKSDANKSTFVIQKLLPELKRNTIFSKEKSKVMKLLVDFNIEKKASSTKPSFFFTKLPNEQITKRKNAKDTTSSSPKTSEEMIVLMLSGDLEINAENVKEIFNKNFKGSITKIKDIVSHFYDETYLHNPSYLTDLLIIIFDKKISDENGELAITHFIGNIKRACQYKTPGTGQEELGKKMLSNIINPYDKLINEDNNNDEKKERTFTS